MHGGGRGIAFFYGTNPGFRGKDRCWGSYMRPFYVIDDFKRLTKIWGIKEYVIDFFKPGAVEIRVNGHIDATHPRKTATGCCLF